MILKEAMNLIQILEQEEIARLGKVIPEFAPGDTVIVSVNVVEGTRKRVQAYEGVVMVLKSNAVAMFAALSCTTCVIAAVNLRVSKKSCQLRKQRFNRPLFEQNRPGSPVAVFFFWKR